MDIVGLIAFLAITTIPFPTESSFAIGGRRELQSSTAVTASLVQYRLGLSPTKVVVH